MNSTSSSIEVDCSHSEDEGVSSTNQSLLSKYSESWTRLVSVDFRYSLGGPLAEQFIGMNDEVADEHSANDENTLCLLFLSASLSLRLSHLVV